MRNDGNWMAQFSNCNNEMIDLEQQCKKQKEVIDKIYELIKL